MTVVAEVKVDSVGSRVPYGGWAGSGEASDEHTFLHSIAPNPASARKIRKLFLQSYFPDMTRY